LPYNRRPSAWGEGISRGKTSILKERKKQYHRSKEEEKKGPLGVKHFIEELPALRRSLLRNIRKAGRGQGREGDHLLKTALDREGSREKKSKPELS